MKTSDVKTELFSQLIIDMLKLVFTDNRNLKSHYHLKLQINAAQARPMRSPMLASLDKLHDVFLVFTLKDLYPTLKLVSRYLTVITIDCTIFVHICVIHRKINNHEQIHTVE